MHFFDEISQHALGDLEIGYDPVPHRPDRDDISRGPSQHAFGLFPDSQDVRRPGLYGHHGRFAKDNAFVLEVDKGGRSAEVDPHIGGEHPDHAIKIFCQLAHHS